MSMSSGDKYNYFENVDISLFRKEISTAAKLKLQNSKKFRWAGFI